MNDDPFAAPFPFPPPMSADDVLFGVDTWAIRNAIARRLFGPPRLRSIGGHPIALWHVESTGGALFAFDHGSYECGHGSYGGDPPLRLGPTVAERLLCNLLRATRSLERRPGATSEHAFAACEHHGRVVVVTKFVARRELPQRLDPQPL